MTDFDELNSQGWFGYEIQKIVSISASVMTAHFNKYLNGAVSLGCFDSRAFNIPREEVPNYFLWRAKDWERNSLQMFCHSLFSHKQLQGKKREDMHEMLHGIGRNWTSDLSDRERNGTFLVRDNDAAVVTRSDILPHYADIEALTKRFGCPESLAECLK